MSSIALRIDRLEKLMRVRGLNGVDLADAAGITKSAVSKILSADRKNPRMDTVAALADALGTTTDYLTGQSDDPIGRAGAELPEYALEMLDTMKGLDRSKNLELLRIAEAFARAQEEVRALRKDDMAAMLVSVAANMTSREEVDTLVEALTALEEGQGALFMLDGRLAVGCD